MLHYKLFNNYISTSVRADLFLLLLFTMYSSLLSGQENYGKIENRLAGMVDDTAKANRLLTLGKHYCSVENDKALMYLQEAYTLSLSNEYTEGIGKSLLWIGRVYYYESNFLLAGKYLEKAKKPLEATGDDQILSYLYFAQAANLKVLGNYVRAIEMFKKSISLSIKVGNKKRLATCYMGIGGILLDRKDATKAFSYFKEALILNKETDDTVSIANVFSNIAGYYHSIGLLDSSLFYLDEALKLRTKLKLDRHIASSEKYIGTILIEMGKYAEAENSLRHAQSIFKRLNERTGIIVTNLSLATAMVKQGNLKGFDLANQTLQLALNVNNPNLLSFVYGKLSTLYAVNNNYQKAFEFQKKHIKLKDSLFTSAKERMMEELETEFQTKKKDEKIELLTEKNRIQRKNNILLGILIVFFGVGVVLLFFLFKMKSVAFMRQRKLREQEQVIFKQEKQLIVQEQKLLKEQLESKNRELASKVLEMIRYNDAISSIIEKLETMSHALKANPEAQKSIHNIIKDIDSNTKQNIWDEFEKVFKNIHSGFYKKLIEVCPDITSSEIKIAALLKLNLTTKEIAAITYKSEGGIKTTRYRLRQKLKLSSDEKLIPFLMQL
ncbi:MAG: hypothetical protein DRJ09_11535 [Bacteroidetes bacterium]|nr:MAG: hypothetical protein DRJ09_11535 [Bacteroidota bacterium]